MLWAKFALVMEGVGLMFTVKVALVPGQALNVGETETVPVIFARELLTGAVQGVICPLPLIARPMFALLLVHVNVAPFGLETNEVGVRVAPGQTVKLLSAEIVATG
jgi:Mg/Co/Ni transporter MgtE